jgi:hypothetical protein
LNKPPKEKKNDILWTIALVNVGYISEVFDFKELVT